MKKKVTIVLMCSMFVAMVACKNTHEGAKGQDTEKDLADTLENPTTPEATEMWEPKPEKITFSSKGIPSDATVLFDGKNFDKWRPATDSLGKVQWTLNHDGSMTVKPGAGDIKTKEDFKSVQLHIEWRTPKVKPGTKGQEIGNSGVFFQDRYEIQVLDSYSGETYSNGQAGSVYKQHIPLVNACKKPEVWQSYDIVFIAPIFDESGKKIESGRFTVFQNGVLIHHDVEILGTTEYIGLPKNIPHGAGPIKLQDHGDLVSYRNIWIRRL